jgi:hypothetical protein
MEAHGDSRRAEQGNSRSDDQEHLRHLIGPPKIGLEKIRKGSTILTSGVHQDMCQLARSRVSQAAGHPTKHLMPEMGRSLIDDESRAQEVQGYPHRNV